MFRKTAVAVQLWKAMTAPGKEPRVLFGEGAQSPPLFLARIFPRGASRLVSVCKVVSLSHWRKHRILHLTIAYHVLPARHRYQIARQADARFLDVAIAARNRNPIAAKAVSGKRAMSAKRAAKSLRIGSFLICVASV